MRIALVYCFPALDPEKYVPAARLFVETYLRHPGDHEHELHVVINSQGTALNPAQVFSPLQPIFHHHNNWAKDLGAFQLAAQAIDCDLLVCMGAHINFWRRGWLDVIARSYSGIGPAMYGAWAFQEPTPHIRTTFFWLPPELLASYPYLKSESERYSFEHGPNSIALWSRKQGFEPYQVTWSGAYSLKFWHPLTLDEGLALDQHTARHLGK